LRARSFACESTGGRFGYGINMPKLCVSATVIRLFGRLPKLLRMCAPREA
jgi:hypothetical protein